MRPFASGARPYNIQAERLWSINVAVITPPKYVRQVLLTLQARGHLAYLVGGCVRDIILGVRPQDWDVCTSAQPQEISDIFPSSRPTGIKHGTVSVCQSSHWIEVTTFRSEGGYSDHRHPDAVSFVGDLTADLSRRDFTMNAIALPPDGLMADPFGGIEDIERRLIRCVGSPELRFEEDALRMLRALRFSARLGFEREEETLAAIRARAPLSALLAAERVRDELEKILLSPAPETAARLIELGLLDGWLERGAVDTARLARIAALPRKPLPRWAALCCILLRSGCIGSTESFLLSMKLDSRTVRCCSDCAYILQLDVPSSNVAWKRLLNRFGVDAVCCAAQCYDVFFGSGCERALKSVLKSGECFSMKHLAVSGDDLLELGLSGRELGEMLRFLLDYVMEYPENNRRELLLSLARGSEEN